MYSPDYFGIWPIRIQHSAAQTTQIGVHISVHRLLWISDNRTRQQNQVFVYGNRMHHPVYTHARARAHTHTHIQTHADYHSVVQLYKTSFPRPQFSCQQFTSYKPVRIKHTLLLYLLSYATKGPLQGSQDVVY